MREAVSKWSGARTAALFLARHLRHTSHDTLWAAQSIRGSAQEVVSSFFQATSKSGIKIPLKGLEESRRSHREDR